MSALFQDHDDTPAMVIVAPSEFDMGVAEDDPAREGDDGPRHRVRIRSAFAVSRCPVTFAEWDALARDGGLPYLPCDEGWGRGKRPVVNVSWYDARAYCRWLRDRTGRSYRLPSEAEWEYCATAGGVEIIPPSLPRAANASSVPVGDSPPNVLGLQDLLGNVWQWLEDVYHPSYAGAPTDGSAWREGGVPGLYMLRGGSWELAPEQLNARFRHAAIAAYRFKDTGFRVACAI